MTNHFIDVDVTVEPLRTFDYRHKPVNRIPMPQRPSWLLEVVRGIPEFAPLTTRQLRQYEPPRRYPERGYPDRPPYDDYDDRYSRRYYDEPENRSYEKIPEKRHVDSPEVRFRDRSPIDRFERREPEPMFRYRERSPPPPRMVERREERDERDFDKYEAKTEKKLSNPVTVGGSSKVTLIEDLLSPPGRFNRPSRIVIILRGPPGSGKTTLAKLIKDKEVSIFCGYTLLLHAIQINDIFVFKLLHIILFFFMLDPYSLCCILSLHMGVNRT